MQLNISKANCSGILFVLLGIAAFAKAQSYEIGTVTNMGPGYIPAVLGLLLMVFGGAALVRSRRSQERDVIGSVDIASLAAVMAGVVLFALSIERVGLAFGIAVLVLSTSYTRVLKHPFEVLVTFVILLAISAGLFIYGLGLPLELIKFG